MYLHVRWAMTATVNLVVKLPAPLRKQAQAVAKLRGETVSDVVRAALREYVQEALEDARDLRELTALEARVEAGLEPLYDHDAVWAEIEALNETR
jgi:Arc/MetJ-type ribon-helix-helix transcriptional regulator